MEKKKIIMILCIALLVMTVGYAALSRVININGTAEITSTWNLQFTSISATGQTDGATEINTPSASGTTATFHVGLKAPGDEITYYITLKNLGTINAVVNEITASELGNDAIKFEVTDIAKGDKIPGQGEKVFKVRISFDSNVTEQPSLNDNTIELTINFIQDLNQTITPGGSSGNGTKLLSKILSDNQPKSDADIDFSKTSEEDGTSGLYYTSTNTENNRTTYYFRGAVDNNYVKFGYEKACLYEGSPVLYTNDYFLGASIPTNEQCTNSNVCELSAEITVLGGLKYVSGVSEEACTNRYGGTWTGETGSYEYVKDSTCQYNGADVIYVDLEMGEFNPSPTRSQCESTNVCAVDGGYVVGIDQATCENPDMVAGIWLEDSAEVTEGTPVDMLWRIVRINEDGSIRLIYQSNPKAIGIGEHSFNVYRAMGNLGYMYGDLESDNYADLHENVHNSEIKSVLDEWYGANLLSYSDLLVDAGFCNDRSIAPEAGLWHEDDTALGYGNNVTYYGAYNRLVNTHQPQFKCPNASQDLFTLSSSTKGNKALTYPIGLITADEAMYAGGAYNKSNSSYYLNSGIMIWTMSNLYGDEIVIIFNNEDEYEYGALRGHSINFTDWLATVLPVINLRADVEIISGDGTVGNEYIIKTN